MRRIGRRFRIRIAVLAILGRTTVTTADPAKESWKNNILPERPHDVLTDLGSHVVDMVTT